MYVVPMAYTHFGPSCCGPISLLNTCITKF